MAAAAPQQEQHSDSEPDSLQGDDVIILQGDGQQGDDDQAELVVRSRRCALFLSGVHKP